MYPNPANVLPFPPRPNLEQYKKRAKELVKACTSGEHDTIRAWAADWIETSTSRAPESRNQSRAELQRSAIHCREILRSGESQAGRRELSASCRFCGRYCRWDERLSRKSHTEGCLTLGKDPASLSACESAPNSKRPGKRPESALM
jgi:hypothetical protein